MCPPTTRWRPRPPLANRCPRCESRSAAVAVYTQYRYDPTRAVYVRYTYGSDTVRYSRARRDIQAHQARACHSARACLSRIYMPSDAIIAAEEAGLLGLREAALVALEPRAEQRPVVHVVGCQRRRLGARLQTSPSRRQHKARSTPCAGCDERAACNRRGSTRLWQRARAQTAGRPDREGSTKSPRIPLAAGSQHAGGTSHCGSGLNECGDLGGGGEVR